MYPSRSSNLTATSPARRRSETMSASIGDVDERRPATAGRIAFAAGEMTRLLTCLRMPSWKASEESSPAGPPRAADSSQNGRYHERCRQRVAGSIIGQGCLHVLNDRRTFDSLLIGIDREVQIGGRGAVRPIVLELGQPPLGWAGGCGQLESFQQGAAVGIGQWIAPGNRAGPGRF